MHKTNTCTKKGNPEFLFEKFSGKFRSYVKSMVTANRISSRFITPTAHGTFAAKYCWKSPAFVLPAPGPEKEAVIDLGEHETYEAAAQAIFDMLEDLDPDNDNRLVPLDGG